jgi:hypothetical protein
MSGDRLMADPTEKKPKKENKSKKEKTDKKERHHKSDAVTTPTTPFEEDWDANRVQIEALCKTPPNNMCNDCNQPGTRWASVNHGVFVCIRCSGIHRSLGTHISKVKSTNMDKWTQSEIRLMELIGNRRAKDLYESRLPKGFKPLSGQEPESVIKNFIVKKYEERLFAIDGIADALKKLHKQSGYGRKGGLPQAAASPTGTKPPVNYEDPMKSLYGNSSPAEKKPKKQKPIEGVFGTVNVPLEEHDARRALLFQHFGIAAQPAAGETPQVVPEAAQIVGQ